MIATASVNDVKTYLIVSDEHVKIGRSIDPDSRMRSIQTGNPKPLEIAAVINGNVEADLHRRFASYRESGEWFRLDGEVRAFVDGARMSSPFNAEDILGIPETDEYKMEVHGDWWVYSCLARDWFGDVTVPASAFQRKVWRGSDYENCSDVIHPEDCEAAFRAVKHHSQFAHGRSFRCEPHVGYDWRSDHHYYIFKMDNNGDTFLASVGPI